MLVALCWILLDLCGGGARVRHMWLQWIGRAHWHETTTCSKNVMISRAQKVSETRTSDKNRREVAFSV